MNQLLRFSGSVERDPAIETWMKAQTGELGIIARSAPAEFPFFR